MADHIDTFISTVPSVTAVTATATQSGSNGVHGVAESSDSSAIYGENTAGGIGVFGRGGPQGGEGVFGQTDSGGSGVYGKSTKTGNGVTGESDQGTGVYGQSNQAQTGSIDAGFTSAGVGVKGVNNLFGGWGVVGEADNQGIGVEGNGGSIGVNGNGSTRGVAGFSETGTGVEGSSTSGSGVRGTSGNVGIYARNSSVNGGSGGNDAYLGAPGFAGDFHGNVSILGTINKPGGGFKIDHPLDAGQKYLSHSFVESPDMKNIYDGVAVFDTNGEAEVELPSWFDTLNTDFRYQLTCIGGYASVYITQEVHDNHFKVAGGQAGMKVSWQVTGTRQDPWANAHRIPIEEEKHAEEQGYYLHPELYGESDQKHIRYVRYPERIQQQRQVEEPVMLSAH